MKRIGLVTNKEHANLTPDDRLVLGHVLPDRVAIEPAVWDADIDWMTFDGLIIRSPWDYTQKYPAFLQWLVRIEKTGIPMWNPPDIVRWNSDKKYLVDLAEKGFQVPPTAYIKHWDRLYLDELDLDADGWFVIKPTVSASGKRTYKVTLDQEGQNTFDNLVLQTDVMVQAFMPEIESEGEYSFIFFWGEFSHAAIKRPQNGDFRVQTYYGGTVRGVQAPDHLIEQARSVVASVATPLMYARVDGVNRGGTLILMELELIEPSLYLASHPDAPARFAHAIHRIWK